MSPSDLDAWVRKMRELGIASLRTKELGIDLDPGLRVAPPVVDDDEDEVLEPPTEPHVDGMCRRCNKAPSGSLNPTLCRACFHDSIRESHAGA